MLVLNFTDNFLYKVLDGDDAVHAAIFIHHHGHVHVGQAHLQQQVEHPHGRGGEQNFTHNLFEAEPTPGLSTPGQNILDMNHATNIIQGFAINRHT